MYISYEKLWHILLNRHMTREILRKECKISSNTIAKLGKGQNVTTDVLLKICKYLDCKLEDIMEIIKE
ncbi:helix-turn-helix domain-containing protein [Megasphaera sueciensis]|uniref:helix-turn-helix domain-containing protein n=1 Tax=Megasphaera sueciensis TaxID=349094 RepID=UPI003CFDAC4E